jgi:hypothetical protein
MRDVIAYADYIPTFMVIQEWLSKYAAYLGTPLGQQVDSMHVTWRN